MFINFILQLMVGGQPGQTRRIVHQPVVLTPQRHDIEPVPVPRHKITGRNVKGKPRRHLRALGFSVQVTCHSLPVVIVIINDKACLNKFSMLMLSVLRYAIYFYHAMCFLLLKRCVRYNNNKRTVDR